MKSKLVWGLVLIGGLVAIGASVSAQQAPPPPPPPPPKWESSAGAGLTLTKGNSDTLLITLKVQTQKKDPKDEWAFGIDGAYGEDHSVKNNETLHGFGQYNRLFTDRFFGYVRLDALHDGIADVDYRVTLGPGVGYYFIKEKMTTLAAEVGPAVVFEKQGGEESTYMTLRLAERFEHKFTEKTRLWQSVEVLPQVNDWENFIVNAEIGVEAALTDTLSLQVYLQDTYDNEPAPGRKSNDLKLVSGVAYKF